jgi:SNF2 family DNA or RNA helicase
MTENARFSEGVAEGSSSATLSPSLEPTREEILRAAGILAGMCDGAVARDGMGFNRLDSPAAKAILSMARPTDRQIRCLWRMLRKYRTQLESLAGVKYETLVPPPEPPPGPEKGGFSQQRTVVIRLGYVSARRVLRVEFPYDQGLVDIMRRIKAEAASSAVFDPMLKTWIFPYELAVYDALIDALEATGRVVVRVDGEIAREMHAAREARQAAYENSRAEKADIDVPTKLPLREFQKAGVKGIELFGGKALLADDPGLGKTPQALGFLVRHPEVLPALVICPATLRANWLKEIRRFTDFRPLLISSKTSLKAFRNLGLDAELAPKAGYDIVVLNYDLLETQSPKTWARALSKGDLSVVPHLLEAGQYALRELRKVYEASKDIEAKSRLLEVIGKIESQGAESNRKKFTKVFVNGVPLKEFLSVGFKSLILDESHYIKDPEAQRSMAVHEISRTVQSVIALTGTPVLNRVRELWSQLYAVNPEIFPKFMPFGMRYCGGKSQTVLVRGGRGQTREVWDFSGATHLEELDEILRSRVMVRRMKSQVLKELPPKIRTTIPVIVKLDEYKKNAAPILERLGRIRKEREEWKALLASMNPEERAAYLTEHAEKAAAQNRLTGVALEEIEHLKQLAVRAKFDDCVEFLADAHEQHGKVVVFTAHHETTDRLVETLRERGFKVGWIDGRIAGPDREPIKTQFQEGDLEFLVCGIRAASEGLTLTASHTVVKIEYDWNPARHVQAEDRCHRITQEHAVNIYYLVAMGTIEEKIVAMIDAKRELVNAAVGEAQRTFEEEGILDVLLESAVSGKVS